MLQEWSKLLHYIASPSFQLEGSPQQIIRLHITQCQALIYWNTTHPYDINECSLRFGYFLQPGTVTSTIFQPLFLAHIQAVSKPRHSKLFHLRCLSDLSRTVHTGHGRCQGLQTEHHIRPEAILSCLVFSFPNIHPATTFSSSPSSSHLKYKD